MNMFCDCIYLFRISLHDAGWCYTVDVNTCITSFSELFNSALVSKNYVDNTICLPFH